MITINSITGSDTVCYNSTINSYGITSVFPNLGYAWTSTTGNITSGQGTNQINLDVSGVQSGSYSNAISVIGVSQLGCQSLPTYYSLVDLNIFPTIDSIGPYCEYDDCVTLTAIPSGGLFAGNNVWFNQYCPDNGFIGIDNVSYILFI
jgi:hypothetical protein